MTDVLLVDADSERKLALWDRLIEEGYHVEMAADGELVARMEACLRRGASRVPEPSVVRFGGIEVDLRGARVLRDGREVAMSPREFRLLRCLVEHAGVPLSRDELLDRAWGHDAMPTPRTVDVHVAWLRRKLEADPHRPTLIRTVHGVGYLFTGGTA